MATYTQTQRTVMGVIHGVSTMEGGGFAVRRPFPTAQVSLIDPFLLLDEMGPSDYGPGEAVGAPDHPHRGFETVTYMLEGSFQHRDSAGNAGVLTPGAVQWMTAGAGVVHSEMPSEEVMERGGRVHGFQLWVNLPAARKWVPPRYQEFPAAGVPTAESPDGLVWARVIAGEAYGVRSVISTHTPISYVHYILQPGGAVTHEAPAGHNAFAYLVDGVGRFGPEGLEAESGDAVVFGRDGDALSLSNPTQGPLSVLVLTGEPLNEPVARYGPFVMNTKDEIYQAIRDYHDGKLGVIAPEG